MSDTDTTYATDGPAPRPSALGDLRFAGTIATGLVAGTLGLGALAAPLVGWKDWPSGPREGRGHDARPPGDAQGAAAPRGLARERSAATAAASSPARWRGSDLGQHPRRLAPAAASRSSAIGGPADLRVLRPRHRGQRADEHRSDGQRHGHLVTRPAFTAVDTADDDGDQIPNDYERTVLSTDAGDASDGSASNGYGVSNSTEFRIKATFPDWDTNGNGVRRRRGRLGQRRRVERGRRGQRQRPGERATPTATASRTGWRTATATVPRTRCRRRPRRSRSPRSRSRRSSARRDARSAGRGDARPAGRDDARSGDRDARPARR